MIVINIINNKHQIRAVSAAGVLRPIAGWVFMYMYIYIYIYIHIHNIYIYIYVSRRVVRGSVVCLLFHMCRCCYCLFIHAPFFLGGGMNSTQHIAYFARAARRRAVPRHRRRERWRQCSRQCACTANLRTKILDFRGFDSTRIWILRGGLPRPTGNFLETLSQVILAGRILVGRLGVSQGVEFRGQSLSFAVLSEFCARMRESWITQEVFVSQRLGHTCRPDAGPCRAASCWVMGSVPSSSSSSFLVCFSFSSSYCSSSFVYYYYLFYYYLYYY